MAETATRPRTEHAPPFPRIVAVLVAWTALWWGIVGGFVHGLVPGGWLAVALAATLSLVVPVALFARGFRGQAYPSAAVRLLIFRPFWYVQLLVPLVASAGILGALVGAVVGAPVQGGRWAIAGTAATLVLAALWGYAGSRRLVVRRLDARFPDLPDGLDGLRIAQVSDLHVGPHTSRRHLARVAERIRESGAELVAFTGDQVDDYARDVESFARAFRNVRGPLGVFAVPGNHDVYAGWAAVRSGMQRAGMTVLVNEAVRVDRGGSAFWIAGTGDPAGQSFERGGGASAAPDIERTMAAVEPGGFAVVLAHNPSLWPGLATRGARLVLSGHTHHGQFSIPHLEWSLASAFLDHAMGAHERDGALLWISPGTNYWGLPFRIGALPEVTVITVRKVDSGDGRPALRPSARPAS